LQIQLVAPMPRLTHTLTLVLLLPLLAPLAGCDHSAPLGAGSYGSDQPFQGGSPRRLTYNLGQDRAPAWLPDESGIVYSYERTDRRDHDRCLAVLPPDGGQIRRTICVVSPAADDSTDLLTEPAADRAGRLAYLAARSRIAAVDPTSTPTSTALVLSTLADPATQRALVTFPYYASDTAPHSRASQPRWLGTDTLVYVALRTGYERHCQGCPVDTVQTGVSIDLLDTSQPTPQVQVLAATRYASSVATGATPGALYYTVGGDSRVFRRVVSTGSDAIVFDFGAAGIARDVQVVGSRLVAVVGGKVSFGFDSNLGYFVQQDSGGPLHVVDLTTGADAVLAIPPLAFRRPALSPSGKRLVAEGYVAGTSDLWEFSLP
jgi:hypothetical protein